VLGAGGFRPQGNYLTAAAKAVNESASEVGGPTDPAAISTDRLTYTAETFALSLSGKVAFRRRGGDGFLAVT